MLSTAALLCGCLAALAVAEVPIHDLDGEFEKFLQDFGKAYEGVEKEVRREVFKANYRFILEENSKGHSYTLGVTEFADMSPEEFALTHLGLKKPEKPWGSLPSHGTHKRSNATLADSVDWRAKGAVTSVKNQAQCGSCWAFSTTGSIEGAWEIATKQLVSLSEQQLVDCSTKFGNQGCNGGLMDDGFQYAEKNALCTEESYPYKARNGVCKASHCTTGIPAGGIVGFKDVPADDAEAMKDAVSKGPVSIAIEADKSVFQLYKSGVLSGSCGETLDHGVLAVGYGTSSDNKDYWIVKNSWGSSWGMEGYAMLLRGKGGSGECGILKQASYPVVKGSPGPAPGPSPPPSPPPPPAPSSPHYEKPPCRDDETEASVQGAGGELCAPSCDASGACPEDVPVGTRAKPQCILQDSASGKKYCALACMLPGSCPTGAKCARVGGFMGVCVYPQGGRAAPHKTLRFARRDAEINI